MVGSELIEWYSGTHYISTGFWATGDERVAQTFQVGTTGSNVNFYINSVTCRLYTQAATEIGASIRNTFNGVPSGTDIGSGIITIAGSQTHTYLSCTINSTPMLHAGSKYAIVLKQNSGWGAGWSASIESGSQPVYAIGSFLSSASGNDWVLEKYGVAEYNEDGYFSTWGIPITTPTAEGYINVMKTGSIWQLPLISLGEGGSINSDSGLRVCLNGSVLCADLVATDAEDASPVRVNTPAGVKSWRHAIIGGGD